MNFELLTPNVAAQAVESVIATPVDGALTGYPSYVNRVYGFGAEDGRQYVAKFYRPGRWSWQAIDEEHRLVAACAAEELPVVAPLADGEGETLHTVTAADGEAEQEFLFAVYPKRGGRNFDADRDQDWLRSRRTSGAAARHHGGRRRLPPAYLHATVSDRALHRRAFARGRRGARCR